MATAELLSHTLEYRRQRLDMSYSTLARISGVSDATARRVLLGHPEVSFGNVQAVATALGVDVQLASEIGVQELREKHARKKAEQIVKMVQGTSGLEGQAVDGERRDEMVQQTMYE